MRLALARLVARLARGASHVVGRTGGTTVPGRVLLRVAPDALAGLSRRLNEGSVLVSATNGKTTTSAMISACLAEEDRPVVHNRAGSNMAWGVGTALLEAGTATGQLGLFEVDEAWLPRVADQLKPKLILLSNLFRDQLDRYGELELLADRWAGVVEANEGRSRFVLCADDPLVADLGREREGVTYFGLDDDSQALPALQHAADSKHCRNCGQPYVYDAVYLGHLGRWHCPNCGRARPQLDVVARRVTLEGMSGSRLTLETPAGEISLRLPLPGLYNVYNALSAAATALELGVGLESVLAALEGFDAAFGRVETIPVPTGGSFEGGRPAARDLSILLIKNPTGANEVLRTLALEKGEHDLWLALNDNVADGRDVSWVWDADFELLAGRVRRVTCSGTRAEEMALRLKYAGVAADPAVDRDLERSLDAAVAQRDGGRPLFALPTYTAMLELRNLLARRGLARRWSE